MKKLVTIMMVAIMTVCGITSTPTEMKTLAAYENYEPPKENPTIPNGVLPVEEYKAIKEEKGLGKNIVPEGDLFDTYAYIYEDGCKGIDLEEDEVKEFCEFFQKGDVILEIEDFKWDDNGETWSSTCHYYVMDHIDVEEKVDLPNTYKTAHKILGEHCFDTIKMDKFKKKKKMNQLEYNGLIAITSDWLIGSTYHDVDYSDVYINSSKWKSNKSLITFKNGYRLWKNSDYRLKKVYVSTNGNLYGVITCKGKMICKVLIMDM